MPTTLESVEHFVFNLCLLEFQCTIPYPNDTQLPVWIFRMGCTPYAASTPANKWLLLYDPMIILSFIVCFRYFNTRLDLSLSSLVLLVNLVHIMIYLAQYQALPLFIPIVVSLLQSVGCPYISFLVLQKYHRSYTNPSSPVTIPLRLDPLLTN